MEQHPVPQDIASFEFHLVGDMTLKQFGYLAAGLAIAYLIFILFASAAPILAWPLIVFFALLGVAFAFLPIMERPLDHWLGAFLKAIFHSTQFTYRSKAIALDNPYFKDRLNIYLGLPLATSQAAPIVVNIPSTPSPVVTPTAPSTPQNTAPAILPQPTTTLPSSTLTMNDTPFPAILEKPGSKSSYTSPEPAKALPSKQELKDTVELAKQAQTIQGKIMQTEEKLNKIKVNAASPGVDPKSYTEEFQTVLSDLQTLNKQASKISNQLATLSKAPPKVVSAASIKPIKPNIIPTLTLTSVPNIINGIVTDSQGNYVEGAIVVAHDKQGLPVRALKSNKLGQFIAATPLPTGIYNLAVEKDNLAFDTIQVELKEQVIPPIVITAKKAERVIS